MTHGTGKKVPEASAQPLLSFREAGDGETVVLLHGSGLSSAVWRGGGYLKRLADFRTVAVDLRGHGRSSKPPNAGAYSAAAMSEDVVAVLDALRIPAAHVVGYSLGARVGFALAATRPERVLSFVTLAGTFALPPGSADAFFFPGCREALRTGDMTGFLESWSRVRGVVLDPATSHALRQNDPAAFGALLEAIDDDPGLTEAEVAGIMAPTLLVAGDSDDPRWQASRRAHELITGSVFVELPGVDHIGTLRDRRALSATEEFLRR
ncbi:alpha/beta fold hydrolase [Microbacterium sp. MMO-35]